MLNPGYIGGPRAFGYLGAGHMATCGCVDVRFGILDSAQRIVEIDHLFSHLSFRNVSHMLGLLIATH